MRLHIPALAVLLSMLGSLAAPASAQSLADLARKEEERRKAAAKVRDPKAPKPKVYTNDDVGNVPAQAPATAATGTPAGDTAVAAGENAGKSADGAKPADAAATAAPQTADPSKGQDYWAGRMTALRTLLERDRSYAEALESRLNALERQFVNTDDPARRRAVDNDRQKARQEMDRLKQAIVDHQKAIADFEEQARREGVPPGWLR